MTTQQQLESALTHHQAGRLAEAEKLYRQILSTKPDHPDALHLLGVIANQCNQPKIACELINQAIASRPAPEFYFNLAQALIDLGENQRAIDALRQTISAKPDWAVAHANLGTALHICGQADEAIGCFRRSIELEPGQWQFRYNLGNAFLVLNRYEEAVTAFTESIQLQSGSALVHNNLGNALHGLSRFSEAADHFRSAIQLQPNLVEAHNNLGNVLISLAKLDQAADSFREGLKLAPNLPLLHNNLGNVLCSLGKFEEAIAAYRHALSLQPNWPEAQNNLSTALRSIGENDAAIAAARQSLELLPNNPLGIENLALALQAQGDIDQAINLLEQLSQSTGNNPVDHARILNSLGNALRGAGRLDESLRCYQHGAQTDPTNILVASNCLFVIQFLSDNPAEILAAHEQWNQQYAAPIHSSPSPGTPGEGWGEGSSKNESSSHFEKNSHPLPEYRARGQIRIAYVSPDFRSHCQALFTSALLPQHDHDQFEIYCYSSVRRPDDITHRLQSHTDVWRDISAIDDAAAAELIRSDQIDILVDLTMHMSGGRPLLFARKPARIQVAWLAYPGSTGLVAMDYRLTDPYLDPPEHDGRYTEKSIRLLNTFWCYDPAGMIQNESESLPTPNELPALKNGYVTFGCLNEFSKISASTLARWARLMQQIPNSRLHLLAPRGKCRQKVSDHLQAFDITPDRIHFVERQPRAAYLAEYHRIDISLDTLPYNGHTTSLDAFWMGVPVLTQIGRTVVGRAGFSQLTNLQLDGFCAKDETEFVELGKHRTGDLAALAQIRRTLRNRMTASPLMDAPRFARNIESVYRQMWNRYIANKEAPPCTCGAS